MTKILIMIGMILTFSSITKADEVVLNEHNTIVMNSQFNRNSVSIVAQRAYELANKLPKGEALNLVIDSGGGSIQAGLELITNLNSLNRPINTICIWCASMAFQTIQGLNGTRVILPFGTMMSHKAKGGFSGEFPGQLTNRLNYYLKRLNKIDQITVDRTGGLHTLQSYQALYENEYWCDGSDCIAQGFSDSVQSVMCDSSLSGKNTKEFAVRIQAFGRIRTGYVNIVTAKCPTVTGVLEVSIKIDGETFTAPNITGLGLDATTTELILKETTKHRIPQMYFESMDK